MEILKDMESYLLSTSLKNSLKLKIKITFQPKNFVMGLSIIYDYRHKKYRLFTRKDITLFKHF